MFAHFLVIVININLVERAIFVVEMLDDVEWWYSEEFYMPCFDTFEIEATESTDDLISQSQVGVVHSVELSLVYIVLAKDFESRFHWDTCWIAQMSSWIGVFYEWAAR